MQAVADVARNPERRGFARENSLNSLTRWLERCRVRAGVEALALADASGCLIAGAGISRLCEELAALAPPTLVSVSQASKANSQAVGRGQAYLSAPVGQLSQSLLTRFASGCARILAI